MKEPLPLPSLSAANVPSQLRGLMWSTSNVGWKLPNNYIKQTFSLQSCYFVDFTTHQSNKYIFRTSLVYPRTRSMPAFSSLVVGRKACKTSGCYKKPCIRLMVVTWTLYTSQFSTLTLQLPLHCTRPLSWNPPSEHLRILTVCKKSSHLAWKPFEDHCYIKCNVFTELTSVET